MDKLPTPTLRNYIARYMIDKKHLKEHPEHKEMLEKRIKKDEQDIISYVTSERFLLTLNVLNL